MENHFLDHIKWPLLTPVFLYIFENLELEYNNGVTCSYFIIITIISHVLVDAISNVYILQCKMIVQKTYIC